MNNSRMLPQHMQQSSFPTSGNPFVSIIPSAGAGVAANNGLSQHYPAHGQAQQQAYAMGPKPQYIPMSAFATDILGSEFPRTMSGDPQGFAQTYAMKQQDHIYKDVLNLLNDNTRETALLELSKKREQYEDLAIVLWHSFGVMSVLLQEIVSVYPLLIPANLSGGASNRVCNALALLQCVANHDETRTLFLSAHIPLYLYPFLNTTSKIRPFEYLRLTSLGVIGALVKKDNPEVISFLLQTEIIPLCLRIMENGSELSKTVAIFIVQKILSDDTGLEYICQTYERFYAVATVLDAMVNQLVETNATRLLKHVIRCYRRLSDNNKALCALSRCLPEPLRDGTFKAALKEDEPTSSYLEQLLYAIDAN